MKYSASTLQFYLVKGPVRFDGLRILVSRIASWRGCPVTAHVLGTSHAFSLEYRGERITELLSCAPGIPTSQMLAHFVVGEAFEMRTRVNGLAYRFELHSFPLNNNDGLTGKHHPECQLEVAYPQPAESLHPLTRIGWRMEGNRLEVETVHTYPEEGTGVRSLSCFEILPEAP